MMPLLDERGQLKYTVDPTERLCSQEQGGNEWPHILTPCQTYEEMSKNKEKRSVTMRTVLKN